MIVHSQVFEIKYKTSLADYTLPYQTNNDLDYDFIRQKFHNFVQKMETEDYDDKLHIMDCKEHKSLLIYFKYVKKNLLLVAAIDRVPGLYDDQLTEKFEKFHSHVQGCATNYFRNFSLLTYNLSLTLQ